jgi:heme exporter protein B
VFLGKFLFNLTLLTVVVTLIVPLFIAVFNFEIFNPGLFVLDLLLGTIALSAGGTIVAALIAKASSRGALFSVLAFPVLLPVLILGITITRIAFKENQTLLFVPEIQTLFAYCVIVITVSMMLFEYIWND